MNPTDLISKYEMCQLRIAPILNRILKKNTDAISQDIKNKLLDYIFLNSILII